MTNETKITLSMRITMEHLAAGRNIYQGAERGAASAARSRVINALLAAGLIRCEAKAGGQWQLTDAGRAALENQQ